MLVKMPRMRITGILVFVLSAALIYLIMISNSSSKPCSQTRITNSSISTKHENESDFHIHAVDYFPWAFKLKGGQFNSKGVFKEHEHKLVSSVIHSFSPYTENRFKEILLDPRHEQRVYANSPALLWHKGELICVMRIWLEKEKYESKNVKKPLNEFNDNYMYIQKFNRHMKPITPGNVIGIPTPRQWSIGDGPIEPRLFKAGEEHVFLSFNTGVILENGKSLDSTFFWDYQRHKMLLPQIEGGSPMLKTVSPNRMPRDKHWTAYMDKGELKMIYNLDPLRVLTCNLSFSCRFSHFEGKENYKFGQQKDALRGGTPWILYEYPYYYSIGHSTLFKDPNYDRIYTINLLIYKASPVPRVVYVSGPIQINEKPMLDTPIVRRDYIKDPFFFPVSAVAEDLDTLAIGGHINDYSSVLLRVRGVKQILIDVVNTDKAHPADMPGPPLGVLHNTSRTLASLVTNFKFYNFGS